MLTLKWDYDDEFIALGCKDGSRMIYCPKERTFGLKCLDKVVEKYECLNENSVTSLKYCFFEILDGGLKETVIARFWYQLIVKVI